MKVELVKIRTIFELTGGRDFNDPEKIESIVVSSIFYPFSRLANTLLGEINDLHRLSSHLVARNNASTKLRDQYLALPCGLYIHNKVR